MAIKRIYHNHGILEEHTHGMWRIVAGHLRQEFLSAAIEFTGDARLYGSWMMRVIEEWPRSCEHNLSNLSINRQAWVGHAATCLAIQCPEDITREAWAHLIPNQQILANLKADEAIKEWERIHIRNNNQLDLPYA